ALVTRFGGDCPILTCTVPVDPGTHVLQEALQKKLPVLVAEIDRFLAPPSILDLHRGYFEELGFHVQGTREPIPSLVKNALFLRVLGENAIRSLLDACPPADFPTLSFVQYSFHGIPDLGIYNARASKGNALQTLLGVLDISSAHALAVGDSQSDRSLLLAVTWRIAMGNASADLKDIATWIAPSNAEDGVAVALERWVLPEGIQPSAVLEQGAKEP
ncbi:MAG: HAD family hydrolase, partial [Chloroflexi bacterium]|nr:HAD family hydrolase [Chloroflexota bacterium]